MSQDEFEMNMRLLGAPTMADVVPSMVDTSALQAPNGDPTMYHANCELSKICPLSGILTNRR